MWIRWLLAPCLLALLPGVAWAQTEPVEGLRDNPPGVHALTGARIVVAPGNVLENATLVIRNGVIEAVGANVTPPADARVWEMTGRTIYAGFVDAYSDAGMPGEVAEGENDRGSVYWNPQVRSFVDAASVFAADDEAGEVLRSQGFAVAMSVPRLGLFRGQTAAVSLGNGAVRDRVLRSGIAQAATLWRDNEVSTGYPTSAMGAIAFIRQTLHDTDWYARARVAYERDPAGLSRPETNAALAALAPALTGDQPLLFEVRSEEEYLRASRFADEFSVALWIRGSGHEYRMIERIAERSAPLILPVAYPDTPSVDNLADGLNVSLAELRHWYLAPENPARLSEAGIEFALTPDGLDDREDFLRNVRESVRRGLNSETALAALTTNPSRLLGIEATHGTLETGKAANLVVTDGDLFEEGTTIQDVWVDGERFMINGVPGVDPRGRWSVVATGSPTLRGELTLNGRPGRLSGTFAANGREVDLVSAGFGDEARRLEVAMPGGSFGMEGIVRLSGTVSGDEVDGWGESPDGTRLNWHGERTGDLPDATNASGRADASEAPRLELSEIRPSMEYGRPGIPERPEHVLVRGATVWTMGPEGVLENADLLVTRGEVVRVGRDLQAPAGARVIDAGGKHVTPGLIDPHIHSGSSGGVNETGSAMVPEVHIGDVLTAHNIWMYRQLAGGLTTALIMHGSANPIGGQNQHVKMRWGAEPEDLRFAGAPRTVKFALGENPKRRSERYPDTRMGTEQIIRDHFQAARDYERAREAWERDQQGIPPRRDLRLEAIADILNGEIAVHSHAYRQDEMLMLMRLAEEFDFRISAFHHGVEAYKVAPELARHGAAAVVWTDWSSFKIEAYDATTYNARVLTDAGVFTSLHSDNSQIASRMNWEAAKMLRTGITEEDALALVTLNPATVLGVEDRVGSLEVGKDADFVLWSGHPLSSFTRAEQTWIDGRKYYDIEEDRRLREETERERARLIQFILNGNGNGENDR